MTALAELLDAQYAQQVRLWGELPQDRLAQRQLAREFAEKLDEERVEYLRAIAYKAWLTESEADRTSRLYEIVDLLKYVMCLAWTEEATEQELVDIFHAKTAVVDERRRVRAAGKKLIAFDIDGVLCEAKQWLPDEPTFVAEGRVRDLLPQAAVCDLVRELSRQDYGILVITTRKAWLYKQLEADTYWWLQHVGVPFDAVLWGYDKLTNIRRNSESVVMAFEDKPKHALDLAQGGIPVVYMGREDMPRHELIAVPERCDYAGLLEAVEAVLA